MVPIHSLSGKGMVNTGLYLPLKNGQQSISVVSDACREAIRTLVRYLGFTPEGCVNEEENAI